MYDLAVFIGRFQPFHDGHKEVIQEAYKQAKIVCVVIGSMNSPRTDRNPFTFEECAKIIQNEFPQIAIVGVEDSAYNNTKWVEDVQHAVGEFATYHNAKTICLAGHEKDHSSYYLKLFPQWSKNGIISVKTPSSLSATSIRERYFLKGEIPKNLIPLSTFNFLVKFKGMYAYSQIREESLFIRDYKKQFESYPYPPKFVTVDACVVQSGHVLLVQRRARPGKDLWALPGGHLNNDEWIEDGIFRELEEETKIKVPEKVLRGNVKNIKVFDDPNRSSRGRTITHAALIHLPPDKDLPKIKGSDDAAVARWWPLADIRREMMFEDHYDLIINLI